MSWPNAYLGEVCSFLSGFAFKSDYFSEEPVGLPIIRIRDVLPGTSKTYYNGPYHADYLISNGDILIGMDGEFNRERWKSSAALLNQRVCKAIAKEIVLDDGYLYHALPSILKRIEGETPFVTVKHLSVAKIRSAEIPLPSLEEQRRIAAILDKGEAIKAFFAKRERAFLAVEESLFAALNDGDNRDLAGRTYLLSDVYWFQEGPGVRNWQFTASGVKLLNVGNITVDGRVDLRKTERHVSEDEAFGRYSHFLVDEGDLLMPSSGISIDEDDLLRTRSAFASSSDLPLCMNTSTIRFKSKIEGASLLFLQGWLQSREFRSQITRLVTGSAQKNFGPSHLKQLSITLPHPDLQSDFVRKLMRIRGLRYSLNPSASKLIALLGSLGHLAFNGGAAA